jgi:hypothetical protein
LNIAKQPQLQRINLIVNYIKVDRFLVKGKYFQYIKTTLTTKKQPIIVNQQKVTKVGRFLVKGKYFKCSKMIPTTKKQPPFCELIEGN